MADIREYKCPACGGAMEFDSKTQKMKCPYCDTVADLSDFEETQSEKTASKEGGRTGRNTGSAEEGAMMLYVCDPAVVKSWQIKRPVPRAVRTAATKLL